jgi:hypothetical protein
MYETHKNSLVLTIEYEKFCITVLEVGGRLSYKSEGRWFETRRRE